MSAAGEFAVNVAVFCRALRSAGIPIGTAQVIAAFHGLAAVGVERRDDVFNTLRATLLTDPGQLVAFRAAFGTVFDEPVAVESGAGDTPPETRQRDRSANRPDPARMRSPARSLAFVADEEGPNPQGLPGGSSTIERLGDKDFAAMDDAEMDDALALLRRMPLAESMLPGRRFVADASGPRFDLRRSIRVMMRRDGELLNLKRRRRQRRPPFYLLICDVSGSMSAYSRVFLQLAHLVTARRPSTASFVFGTRLTEVGSILRTMDADRALTAVASAARDIDGGTRIARSLEAFNRRWARRLPLHEATVILLSDGLERDTESDLEFQVARLHRFCRELIWLNPMLRYAGFEPKAYGIRTMLPHVDHFLPAHNLDSIRQLAELLAESRARGQWASR